LVGIFQRASEAETVGHGVENSLASYCTKSYGGGVKKSSGFLIIYKFTKYFLKKIPNRWQNYTDLFIAFLYK